jgi:hypothetical protein
MPAQESWSPLMRGVAANAWGNPVQVSLPLPLCPEGDCGTVQAAGHLWQDITGEIHQAVEQVRQAIPGTGWSGTARRAFDAAWAQYSARIHRSGGHAQEMGDTLLLLALHLGDAQHAWRLGRGSVPPSVVKGDRITVTSDSDLEAEVDRAMATIREAVSSAEGCFDDALRRMREATIGAELLQDLMWHFQALSDVGADPVSPGVRWDGDALSLGNPATMHGASHGQTPWDQVHSSSGGPMPPDGAHIPDSAPDGDPGGIHAGNGAHGSGFVTDAAGSAHHGTGGHGTSDGGLSGGDIPVVLSVALAAAVLVAEERRRRGAEGSGEKVEGSLEEMARSFSEMERSIAELLHAEGSEVSAVAEAAERTPSALVDGHPTAFKLLAHGANHQTLTNVLNSATGQAGRIVVGARGSGLSEADAQAGLHRFLHSRPPGVSHVRIIGDDFDLRHPRRDAA